jgi:hypothetical protein
MSITSITSESLQARLRALLPSQQGFGDDISASNTIIPIVDLTDSASGATTPESLQQALSFSDITEFNVTGNSTVQTLINTTGFWLLTFSSVCTATGSECTLRFKNGSTTKRFFRQRQGADKGTALNGQFILFLQAGDQVEAFTGNTNSVLLVAVRQIADINGVLVNPTGFTPQ